MIGHKTYYRVNDVRSFVREHMDFKPIKSLTRSTQRMIRIKNLNNSAFCV